jgi:arylsulfatase A-like enzyme
VLKGGEARPNISSIHEMLDTSSTRKSGEKSSGQAGLSLGFGTLMLLAVWFGLLTGLLECGLLGAKRYVLKDFISVSPMVVWMSPLAYVVLFSVVAVGLAAFRRPFGASRVRFGATATFGALAAFSLLTLLSRVHPAASAALAVGLGLQAARVIRRHAARLGPFMRITAATMTLIVLCLGTAVHLTGTVTERRSLAALPPAAPNVPNILLLVLDTVRAASVDLTGAGRGTTPRLEQIAKEGVRFTQAISTAPWTLPSHASMFTGHYPADMTATWDTPLDDTFTTLAEVLASRGYATGGFVANTSYAAWESGLGRGFAHYDDYQVTLGQVLHSCGLFRWLRQRSWLRHALGMYDVLGRRRAPAVTSAFLTWMAAHDERPVFAFLNYYDAHAPYLPPEPYRSRFGTPALRQNPLLIYQANIEGYPPEAVGQERDAYEAAIAYLDGEIGALVDELRRRDVLDNTVLIIVADHGEEFDEHGRLGHGNSLYMPVTHVPLIMRFPPRIAMGTEVTTPVSLVDLAATILDLSGVTQRDLPGSSLASTWEHHTPGSPVLSEEFDMQSIRVGPYHYIVTGPEGREEFYDVQSDPWEQHDLAAATSTRDVVDCFRSTAAARFVGAQACAAVEGTW